MPPLGPCPCPGNALSFVAGTESLNLVLVIWIPPIEFYLLPLPLLRRALDILVKQGKASIFKGEDGMEGVKFF